MLDLWEWALANPGRAAVAAAVVGPVALGAMFQERAKARPGGPGGAQQPAVDGSGAWVGRLLTGRDLRPGEPRSSATWWRVGVPVERDTAVHDLAVDAFATTPS
ncbi:hypothetical protein, partial [Streptomyces sp. NPDC048606]|uniref:hypothetical protein n=1 Tax=Streptomyces sp. NPDC048606 TaxID=3154726 RepID=UPI00344A2769